MPILVAGETLVDLMVREDGLIEPKLGGSPFNFALALARLGGKVTYANPLSFDTFGRQFAKTFTEAGVQFQTHTSRLPTSLACVTTDTHGAPSYAFYREGVADRDWDPSCLLDSALGVPSFFHVGSLALIPPDGTVWAKVLKELRNKGCCTSVDVNMRLVASNDHPSYIETIQTLMGDATLLKVSDEDLVSLGRDGNPLQQARALLNSNTRLVVLTLGSEGAWALTQESEVFQVPANVEVVDSVGAGDCFYAGFVAALADSNVLPGLASELRPSAEQLIAALAFANKVTAINLTRRGCVPPWRAEVLA
jgi:fructokinase